MLEYIALPWHLLRVNVADDVKSEYKKKNRICRLSLVFVLFNHHFEKFHLHDGS